MLALGSWSLFLPHFPLLSWITSSSCGWRLHCSDHHLYFSLAVHFYCQPRVVAFMSMSSLHSCILEPIVQPKLPPLLILSSFIFITHFLHSHRNYLFLNSFFLFPFFKFLLCWTIILSSNHRKKYMSDKHFLSFLPHMGCWKCVFAFYHCIINYHKFSA